MKVRLDWLKEKKYYIMNENGQNLDVRSFWTMSYRNDNFILLDQPCKLTIGRSSSNSLVIC
jgi:hypothetical protein